MSYPVCSNSFLAASLLIKNSLWFFSVNVSQLSLLEGFDHPMPILKVLLGILDNFLLCRCIGSHICLPLGMRSKFILLRWKGGGEVAGASSPSKSSVISSSETSVIKSPWWASVSLVVSSSSLVVHFGGLGFGLLGQFQINSIINTMSFTTLLPKVAHLLLPDLLLLSVMLMSNIEDVSFPEMAFCCSVARASLCSAFNSLFCDFPVSR